MSSVRNKNTKPELVVRSILHRNGFRFRLHRKDLPGSPDIVLPKYKVAIFVHGCYWHGHDCIKGRRPASNRHFWNQKLDKNLMRDKKNYSVLRQAGWKIEVLWECEAPKATVRLINKLRNAQATASASTELAK